MIVCCSAVASAVAQLPVPPRPLRPCPPPDRRGGGAGGGSPREPTEPKAPACVRPRCCRELVAPVLGTDLLCGTHGCSGRLPPSSPKMYGYLWPRIPQKFEEMAIVWRDFEVKLRELHTRPQPQQLVIPPPCCGGRVCTSGRRQRHFTPPLGPAQERTSPSSIRSKQIAALRRSTSFRAHIYFVLVLFTLWIPELNDSSTTKETKEANEAHGPPQHCPPSGECPAPRPPATNTQRFEFTFLRKECSICCIWCSPSSWASLSPTTSSYGVTARRPHQQLLPHLRLPLQQRLRQAPLSPLCTESPRRLASTSHRHPQRLKSSMGKERRPHHQHPMDSSE